MRATRVTIDLIEPEGDGGAIVRWLRASLKTALRTYRLRCVAQAWEPVETPGTVRRPGRGDGGTSGSLGASEGRPFGESLGFTRVPERFSEGLA